MNPNLVNADGSNYSGNMFTAPPLPKLDAAVLAGGKQSNYNKRIYKSKINKISRMYKMRGSRKNVSRRVRRIKSRIRSVFRPRTKKHSRRYRKQRGGSSSYSTGSALPASLSALANPVPFTKLDDSVNCPSSYNHYK
jgi:hypothetical protein